MKYFLKSLLILVLGNLIACQTVKKTVPNNISGDDLVRHNAQARAIIYKTLIDYYDKVPVLMNEQRTKIISYPEPVDLLFHGKPALPSILNNGYLLDNKGINLNVAFLSYTYDEYSKLKKAPDMKTLIEHLADKYPLTEMYDCGVRSEYKNLISEINILIDRGLTNCKKLDVVPMGIVLEK